MSTTFKTVTVLTISLLALLNIGPFARAQDEKSIAGRMELETHDDYFRVRVFLTNKTDHDIIIETGRGREGRGVTPFLSCTHLMLKPSKWLKPAARSLRPDPLTLKPGVEILYDTYIIPPAWRSPYSERDDLLEGFIQFHGLDKDHLDTHTNTLYPVRLGAQKLPPKPGAVKTK